MRSFTVLLLACSSLSATSLTAQEHGEARPQTVQRTVPIVREEDGGVREMVESIVVSAKPQAPFTLTLETEWVRTLAGGGVTLNMVNKRRIARDATGRTYQERWQLVFTNGTEESRMNVVQIADPNAHTLYNCFFVGSKKNLCELLNYTPTAPAVNLSEVNMAGELPSNQGSFLHEILGKQSISGVDTVGVHEATTYKPGAYDSVAFGKNDREMTVDSEMWYSPHLDLNLLSVRSDPHLGRQTFTARNVILGDPDPALFELPAGFRVVGNHGQSEIAEERKFQVEIQPAADGGPEFSVTNLSSKTLTACIFRLSASSEAHAQLHIDWDAFMQAGLDLWPGGPQPLEPGASMSRYLPLWISGPLADKVGVIAGVWADGSTFGEANWLKVIFVQRASMVSAYEKAISLVQKGLDEKWTRSQYLAAAHKKQNAPFYAIIRTLPANPLDEDPVLLQQAMQALLADFTRNIAPLRQTKPPVSATTGN